MIYRPHKTSRITQHFNENKACVKNNRITECKPGLPSIYQYKYGMEGHNGIDIDCWRGEPAYFSVDLGIEWKVNKIGDDSVGLHLEFISTERVEVVKDKIIVKDIKRTSNGQGQYVKIIYGHLLETPLNNGDIIKFGDYFGKLDNTGQSTGDHVHIGFKECDRHGEGINKWNGYYGALDFTPVFENVYVGDIIEIKKIQMRLVDILRKYVTILKTLIRS